MRTLLALLAATTAAEPLDDKTIRKAVKLWARDEAKATKKYGHISTWDTSAVTDMDYLLGACWSDSRCVVSWSFNEDITAWDTSNVRSMVIPASYVTVASMAFLGPARRWGYGRQSTRSR